MIAASEPIWVALWLNSRACSDSTFIWLRTYSACSSHHLVDVLGGNQLLGKVEGAGDILFRERHGFLRDILGAGARGLGPLFKSAGGLLRHIHKAVKGFPGLFDALFRKRTHLGRNCELEWLLGHRWLLWLTGPCRYVMVNLPR